ncbi:MAG: hypothetical protein ACOCWX_06405 [Spirochaetota bacterium]
MAERTYDFRPFEASYGEWEAQFSSGGKPGEFSYRIGGPTSLYGTTDAVISRATIGLLPVGANERAAWAAVINGFQDPRTGWYRKRYTLHFRSHTAAYAVAALALLGHRPARPVDEALRVASSREATVSWLERIPWSIVWPSSHIVAGLPAILHMTGQGSKEFWETYFAWLDAHVHPQTGFWSRGLLHRIGVRRPLAMAELGGAFHMHFVYEARGRRWPLPERVVDAALALQHANGLWDGEVPYCIDLDGLYSMIRSSRYAGGYREADVLRSVHRYLAQAERTLCDRDFLFARYLDSHRLTGALSAVAECAKWYPGLVVTGRAWRQTLDEACFI